MRRPLTSDRISTQQALAARQRRKLAVANMAPFSLSFGMEEYAHALQVFFRAKLHSLIGVVVPFLRQRV